MLPAAVADGLVLDGPARPVWLAAELADALVRCLVLALVQLAAARPVLALVRLAAELADRLVIEAGPGPGPVLVLAR